MGRATLLMDGLWSTMAVCLLVISCLAAVDCVKLSKLALNTDRHEILPRSPFDTGCDSTTCLNGGTCTGNRVYGFCICPGTHIGLHCEMENPCNDNPCQNGGSCVPDFTGLWPTDSTMCFCRGEWSGSNCENAAATSGCVTYTCRNGGTCFSFKNFPFCECAPGFTGDECEHTEPCLNVHCPESHVCVNILGNGHCVCVAGFTGPDCVIDTDGNNDCANNDPCLNGGTCDDTAEPGFKICRCPSGYDGLYCENEVTSSLPCNNRHTPCANGGTCEQYDSSYYCHCTLEYFGANCTESIFFPYCRDYCENGGSCYIDESTPHCACTPSWEGRQCSVPKHQMATEATVPDCTIWCGDYGECRLESNGDRYCRCDSGWSGDHCQNKDNIATVPSASVSPVVPDCTLQCGDYGECRLNSNGERYCRCDSGWSGDHCQNKVPDCTLQCGDYGECRLNSNRERYCRCDSGWRGDHCQNKDNIATVPPASVSSVDIATVPPASGSSVGALVGSSVGGVLLLIIILVAFFVIISMTRATNRRRQQSHSHAVGYSNSVAFDPRFVNEYDGFAQAQRTVNPGPFPAKDLYGSSQAKGSNMPRRNTQNAVQNDYGAKEPRVIYNPASAYQYAYGAAPPARKTSQSTVPPEKNHEYAYVSGDYQPLRLPTAARPPPSFSGAPSIAASAAPSIAASAAPSIAASAEHTYQSLSEFGDTGRSNKH